MVADGRVLFEPEFRFMLMRHWTLFNSMLHSRYLACRLGVWRDRGRRMLETMLVKMGIPLAVAQHDYAAMDLLMKESLPNRITKHAADFGLDASLSFPSFTRQHGYVMRVSASDACYALMALLEAPYDSSVDKPWLNNFYHALTALDRGGGEVLRQGIQLAMRQQQVILAEATNILSHTLLRFGRRFRYAILRHTPDLAWLSGHPLSLAKLAHFLVDALANTRRASQPLLLAAAQSTRDTYLVVAVNGSRTTSGDQFDHQIVNRFGLAFRRVAQRTRARVKLDGFDASVIEVRSDDLKPFLQALQTIPL